MSDKSTMPISIEEQITKSMNYLYNNHVSLDFIREHYNSKKYPAKEKRNHGISRNVDWSHQGIYFINVHRSAPLTTTLIEEPNGSVIKLYEEEGNGGADLISAIQRGVVDAPEGKPLGVVCGSDQIVKDVNDLAAIKANNWVRPNKSKSVPANLIYWQILSDTLEEKGIKLFAGKTKEDALLLSNKVRPEVGEVSGGVNAA